MKRPVIRATYSVKSLIGAGYDTTASSLAWILWEASTDAGVWRRLSDEADTVFAASHAAGPNDRTRSALDRANRTMRESLRLHRAFGVGAREAPPRPQGLMVGPPAGGAPGT